MLIFPGGTEVGLELRASLATCKGIELVSAGLDVSNHAPFAFARHHLLPSVHSSDWLTPLNELLQREEIDYVFPAYDDVVLALAEARPQLARACLVSSPARTSRICRSKSSTYQHLAGRLPLPRRYTDPSEAVDFPVFVKPDQGQGSQRARAVTSRAELERALASQPDLIVLEHLPGPEYTIDCLSDRAAGLLFVGARRRVRTRAGISMASEPVEDPRFRQLAEAIAGALEFHGAWFFQVKERADGELTLLEVAPRIAGTSSLHRASGVNFALLSLYEQDRVSLRLLPQAPAPLDRALVNRFRYARRFRRAYVDLDDTLILAGAVHPPLVALLYQFLNRGVELVLLTRHRGDLQATLARHRLGQLFDRVVHLGPNEPKSAHVEGDAIFIDDSFRERLEVAEAKGIPTFDLSMLELLRETRC